MSTKWLAALILLCAFCAAAGAAHMSDVSPDHWAYEAVERLAERGLVMGYPDGRFLGGRSLTRYEMATIIKRVLDEIDQRNQDMESRLRNVESKPAHTGDARDSGTSVAPHSGVSAQDLADVKKLVDEYKVELTVIGADLSKLKDQFEEMQGRMEGVEAAVSDPEGPLQTVINDVKKLKAVKISGYVQARWEAGGKYNSTTKVVENYNGFFLRRARFKLSVQKGNTVAVINPDFGKSGFKDAATGIETQTPNADKDYYVQYMFSGDPALGPSLSVGQMNWPFGYDVPYSSSARECPERSRVATTLFPGERDRGIKISSKMPAKVTWELGLFNGAGTKENEKNQRKDIVGNIHFASSRSLAFGFSGYWGKNNNLATKANPVVPKTRWGVDLQYYLPETTFKGEYIRGRQDVYSGGKKIERQVSGWWAQIARNIGKSNTLVARYDTYNPDDDKSKFGRQSAWDLGIIHSLDDATKLKIFYQINKEERNAVSDNITRVELLSVF